MFERITFDPDIMGGRACIRGLRIPVSVIVSQIAHGASFEEVLADFPDLQREDIQQAMEYAAWLTEEQPGRVRYAHAPCYRVPQIRCEPRSYRDRPNPVGNDPSERGDETSNAANRGSDGPKNGVAIPRLAPLGP